MSCLGAQSGKFTYVQLGDVGIEGLQNLLNQDTEGIEYTILYYAADFCAPCKKIKKSI